MKFATEDVAALAEKADETELSYDDPIGEYLRGLAAQRDRLLTAVKSIAAMSDPDDMDEDEDGFTEWGCEKHDAVAMAYENCITIAQLALGDVTSQ